VLRGNKEVEKVSLGLNVEMGQRNLEYCNDGGKDGLGMSNILYIRGRRG